VLRQEWRRAVRDESPLSLLFCDIDYFKRFNDSYGHQAGDECLVRVAQAMEETLNRPADLVARYGGEEFIALLVDTDPVGARLLADRMRRTHRGAADRAPRLARRDLPDGEPGRRHRDPEPDAAARGPRRPRRPRALRLEGRRPQPHLDRRQAAGRPHREPPLER
jgi:GGDEF domain-containing protein